MSNWNPQTGKRSIADINRRRPLIGGGGVEHIAAVFNAASRLKRWLPSCATSSELCLGLLDPSPRGRSWFINQRHKPHQTLGLLVQGTASVNASGQRSPDEEIARCAAEEMKFFAHALILARVNLSRAYFFDSGIFTGPNGPGPHVTPYSSFTLAGLECFIRDSYSPHSPASL
jgi:hypothetical protein